MRPAAALRSVDLPAARGAHDRDELARRHREVDRLPAV
jgi:hypothetical protein